MSIPAELASAAARLFADGMPALLREQGPKIASRAERMLGTEAFRPGAVTLADLNPLTVASATGPRQADLAAAALRTKGSRTLTGHSTVPGAMPRIPMPGFHAELNPEKLFEEFRMANPALGAATTNMEGYSTRYAGSHQWDDLQNLLEHPQLGAELEKIPGFQQLSGGLTGEQYAAKLLADFDNVKMETPNLPHYTDTGFYLPEPGHRTGPSLVSTSRRDASYGNEYGGHFLTRRRLGIEAVNPATKLRLDISNRLDFANTPYPVSSIKSIDDVNRIVGSMLNTKIGLNKPMQGIKGEKKLLSMFKPNVRAQIKGQLTPVQRLAVLDRFSRYNKSAFESFGGFDFQDASNTPASRAWAGGSMGSDGVMRLPTAAPFENRTIDHEMAHRMNQIRPYDSDREMMYDVARSTFGPNSIATKALKEFQRLRNNSTAFGELNAIARSESADALGIPAFANMGQFPRPHEKHGIALANIFSPDYKHGDPIRAIPQDRMLSFGHTTPDLIERYLKGDLKNHSLIKYYAPDGFHAFPPAANSNARTIFDTPTTARMIPTEYTDIMNVLDNIRSRVLEGTLADRMAFNLP